MGPREHSRFKIVSQAVASDSSLTEDRGWQKMDVRWLITSTTMPSRQTVVGKTTMPPGVNAQHSMHRHPNGEEWEYVVQGEGIKRVGDEAFVLRAGDIAFVPRNEYHSLKNASDTETLVTIWGYCGASSLEEAGYFTPEDYQKGGDRSV